MRTFFRASGRLTGFACLWAFLVLVTPGSSAAQDRMPAFQLKDINSGGRVVSDADLRGKVILLNLWASWCPGCKDEMPELISLQDSFGPERFSVIAVNIDNRMENALSFMEKYPAGSGRGLNFPVLYDQDKVVARALRPTLMPTSYIIDAQGRIRHTLGGSITEGRLDEVREAIRTAMEKP